MEKWCARFLGLTISLALICCAGTGCGGGGSPDTAPPLPTDTSPPRITGVAGVSDGDLISTAVSFSATATDDTGIASFRLSIGGEQVVDAQRTEIIYVWDVRQITGGPYALTFAASDAAGNTDTETLNVTVLNDNMPLDWEPIPDPQVEEKLTVQPVYDFDYVLPPMDPALYNPQDSGTPTLLLVGIRNNDWLYGARTISATATDDTGVNVITMLVDGYQLALEEGYSLRYEWDTTVYADGEYTVTFVVRDNGANVGQCSLEVTVNNTSDHDGPTTDPVTGTTWSIYGLTGDPFEAGNYAYRGGITGAGDIHLHVTASDPSGVAKVELQLPHGGEVIATAIGDTLDYTWHSQAAHDYDSKSYWIVAEDALGNTSIATLGLYAFNTTEMSGYLRAANGAIVENLAVSIRPGHYSSVAAAAEAPILQDGAPLGMRQNILTHSDMSGWFSLEDGTFYGEYFSCGLHTLFVESEDSGFQAMFPMVFEPRHLYFLEEEDAFVFPTAGGSPQPNWRVAVVTGSEDDAMSAFDVLFNTECHYFVDADAGIPQDIVLIDGDDSLPGSAPDFLDFVRSPEQLYKYRCILIESGNAYEQEWAGDEQAVSMLRTWVADGGQLLLTNHAYDFCEQMFPEKLDFAGDDEQDGLGPIPEGIDVAEQGGPIGFTYVSSNEYCSNHRYAQYWSNLGHVLYGLGASDDDLVPGPAWTVIDNVATPEDVLMRGRDASVDAGQPNQYVDLAVQVSYGQGRVIVTSFPLAQTEYSPKLTAALFMDMALFSH